MRVAPKGVDEYLASVPSEARALLEEVRATIREAMPGAREVISYQVPTFKLPGVMISYAAFKNHCSLFGLSTIFPQFEEELKGFIASKGTIHFSADKPLSTELVTRMVKARIAETKPK